MLAMPIHRGVAGRELPKRGYGHDALQALLLTLQKIGIELYVSNEHKDGQLFWLEPGNGYGFPVPRNVRDLLVGQDRETFG